MNLSYTPLTESTSSVRLLRINGCPPYCLVPTNSKDTIRSRWEVDGYEWEVRFYPIRPYGLDAYHDMELQLILLSAAREKEVRAQLSCRLIDPDGILQPSAERSSPVKSFQRPIRQRKFGY